MRKGILAIAAAGSIFALTAAGASGLALSTGTSDNLRVTSTGAATSLVTSECTGAPAFSYTYTSDVISAVTITGLTCTALDNSSRYSFALKLNNTGDPFTAYRTAAVASTDTVTVVIDPAFDQAGSTALTSVNLTVSVVDKAV